MQSGQTVVLVTELEKNMGWKVHVTSPCKISHDFCLDNKEDSSSDGEFFQ